MGVAGAGKSTLSEATSQEDMIDVDEDLKSRKLPDKVSPHPKSLCSGFNTPFCGYKRCWKNQMNDSFKRLGRPKSFAQSSSKRAVVWHLLKWPAIGVGAVSSTVINSYYSSTQFSRDSASPWGKHPPNRDWISGGAVWYCRPRSNGRADSGGLSRVVSLGYMSLHGLQKWTQVSSYLHSGSLKH